MAKNVVAASCPEVEGAIEQHTRFEIRSARPASKRAESVDNEDQGGFSGSLAHLPWEQRRLFWLYGLGQPEQVSYSAVHHAFEHQARQTPDAIAVSHLTQSISYRQLDEQANRLAGLLIGLGIVPGDCVPLFLERSIEMVVGIMAILKTGASYVPQDAAVAPATQLDYIVRTTGAKFVLTLGKFMDKMPKIPSVLCLAVDDLQKYSDDLTCKWAEQPRPMYDSRSSAVCIVLFTSGTTGKPNGVQVTHKNLCNILLTSPGNLGIRSGDRVAQLLSISFDMAAWEILGCLVNGGSLLIRGSSIAEAAQNATVLIATPSILSLVDPVESRDVRKVAVAGEPCPRHLADTWAEQATFFNACGPTETTIVNTMYPHDKTASVMTIGKPTPNNTVYILDESGEACPIGEVGEMWAGGDCVTAGYLNNQTLTQERYRPDAFLGGGRVMFNTRDLARWTEDGLLEHLGRTDDQVKVRGFRVELDSVSAILESVEGCQRAAALKYDSRHLVAFVAPETVDTDKARRRIAEALPYYCVPAFIEALPELPLTERGKIDKRALARQARASAAGMETVESVSKDRQKATNRQSDQRNTMVSRDATGVDDAARADAYLAATLPAPGNRLVARLAHHTFYHYWRLAAVMLAANIMVLIHGLTAGHWWSTGAVSLSPLMHMVVANLTIAVVFRQQYVINLLFKAATSTPLWMPLRFRQLMGKVYHFGGLHLGGAIAATAWMLLATATLIWQFLAGGQATSTSVATLVLSVQITLVLLLMLIMARPSFRARFHNGFEMMHRFGGWTALLLFWALTLSFIHDFRGNQNMLSALSGSVIFWCLVLVTVSIVLPWLRLRKVPVQIDRPSNHVAIVRFDYGVKPFAGSSTTISRSPLTEWHSFANVPSPRESGFRLTISRAGDWTGKLIDEKPSHVWVKGIPTAGVGNVDKLFRRVVWVATGSGIGPALPHLLAQEVPAHLIWSTRNARTTYGDALVDEILDVEPDALIWDTDSRGRPDLVHLAYSAVQSFDAEAVIVIANEKVTRLVVHGMESRGIPAYGAIWDS